MKIDILCNDGSPLGVTHKSIWGHDGRFGVGGAELALLTMCEEWAKAGHDVTLYNNPSEGGVSPFEQRGLHEFIPDSNRDVLIVFRSPNERIAGAKGLIVWWSCDQFTVGDFERFSKKVHKIVTISDFHNDYFEETYKIRNAIKIDLPVRVSDYEREVKRVSKRCVYTSIPDRGVMQLHAAWPLIAREVPDASLVLTSDWRLWDPEIDKSVLTPFKLSYSMLPNCSYVGAVTRDKLIEYQLSADLLLYPCVYDELFCIAVAEAQVAGAIPVTSQVGAVKTTNSFGFQIEGSPYNPAFVEKFAETAVKLLTDPGLELIRADVIKSAIGRFSPERILKEWDEKVFK